MKIVTTTLQYVWPILDPAGEEPLTRAEVLEHAYPALEQVADEAECAVVGPPLWIIQPGSATTGWTTWPGRVLIALVPVHFYGQPRTDDGEPRFTRTEWEEIRESEAAQAELEAQAARQAAERAQAARDRRVRELHAAGLTIKEMERVLGIRYDRVRSSLSRCGLTANVNPGSSRKSKNGRCPFPQEGRVSDLHTAGLSIEDIARALDVTVGAVTVVLGRLGLTPTVTITAEALERDARMLLDLAVA